MPSQFSNHCQNDISIQDENTRFAFMFILFTLLAFLITIFLFIFANNSYYNQSEIYQRYFIPYSILASISLSLFFIFFIGSLVYTSKSLRKLLFKSSLNSPIFKLQSTTTTLSCQTNV
jgi:hypothetical protein